MSAHPSLPPFGRETANRWSGSQGALGIRAIQGKSPPSACDPLTGRALQWA
jgi:hypothetical protein